MRSSRESDRRFPDGDVARRRVSVVAILLSIELVGLVLFIDEPSGHAPAGGSA